METNEVYSKQINSSEMASKNSNPSNNNTCTENILSDGILNKFTKNNENSSDAESLTEHNSLKVLADNRLVEMNSTQNSEGTMESKYIETVGQANTIGSSNINIVLPTENEVFMPVLNEAASATLGEDSSIQSETIDSTIVNGQEKCHSSEHCQGLMKPAMEPDETLKENFFNLSKENDALNTSSKSADFKFPHPDKSIVISNNNAIPQAESIVASNYSLAQLKSYGSDESLNSDTSDKIQCYREGNNEAGGSDKDSDSESSSSSSSTSIYISSSSDSDSDEVYENIPPRVYKPIKSKNEMTLNDLPPIEDLKISIPEEEIVPIGKVYQIVDQLVVVQSLKDIPAYDLDTVLFVEGGLPLGKIFDVFGPVTEPYYCVRFNSKDHIKERKINLEQVVYCAPKTRYTNYVFLAQLMKLRGSDASWENDDECPDEFLDYSDDEQESNAKSKKKPRKKGKYLPKVHSDPDEPARKRHSAYEKRMNERNLQLTAVRSCQSQQAQGPHNILWPSALPINRASTSSGGPPVFLQNTCHQIYQHRPALFNPGGAFPNNSPPFHVRPNISSAGYINVHSPSGVINSPPPYFVSPNNFSNFPGPQHGPGPSSRPFPPAGVQPSFFPNHSRAPGEQGPGSIARWGIIPVRPSGFLSPRPPPPIPSSPNNSPIINNNFLQNSCFPSQRPPLPHHNMQPQFSALPNPPFCPTLPSPPPPPPHSFSRSPVVNFNPHIPPPPPSQSHPFGY